MDMEQLAQQAAQQSGASSALMLDLAQVYYRHHQGKEALAYSAQRLAQHFSLLKRFQNAPILEVFEADFAPKHSVVMLVAPDRPFLIDTLRMGLDEAGVAVHELLHCIIQVERHPQGEIEALHASSDSNTQQISMIYAAIDRIEDGNSISKRLLDKIEVLNVVTADFAAMRQQLLNIRADYEKLQLPAGSALSRQAVCEFLDWLADDHFTFLGFRAYALRDGIMHQVAHSGLGMLRDDGSGKVSSSYQELSPELQRELLRPEILWFSKSGRIAPVHRPMYMDFIGIQQYNEAGELIGEYRLLGLFTATAYQLPVWDIPLLRDKVKAVLNSAQFPQGGYADKRLRFILNEFPRDELFQLSQNDVRDIALGVLHLQDRNHLRLFLRTDHYQRFVSALVYVPRDKFNTETREKIQQHLQQALQGTRVEFNVRLDPQHARLALHIKTQAGQVPQFDESALETQLNQIIRDWGDDYLNLSTNSEEKRFLPQLPSAYRDAYTPAEALADVRLLLTLNEDDAPQILQVKHDEQQIVLKFLGRGRARTPTDLLPVLEHFGVRVESIHSYDWQVAGSAYWAQAYQLALTQHVNDYDSKRFLNALNWALQQESDRLNELVLRSRLDADDIMLLRALARYIQQAAAPFSPEYIQQTLCANPQAAEALVALFAARFHPALQKRDEAMQEALQAVEQQLQNVNSLDEDRILRWFLILIQATVRCNFYQHHKQSAFSCALRPALAFKFRAKNIPDLPQPKPMFEIFVYAPDVEGVHLRGGKVARGGIRWSDRMDDYRTEVLGLVKAQMVKNTIIVPVGSKGGFIVKRKTSSREAWLEAGQACYKRFIGALLSLTDNLQAGALLSPPQVVRHDEDDPYLVVAADKGTASFSNLANSVSAEYGFWLGDAFASGGSAGYDHKGMGITARGGWESVKRHFRHLGKDIQNRDEITVVGIGDMSGDVFGNAMLLSNQLKVVAAFNHLHIFIDPNPNPKLSFAERKRLFELPRSTWADYQSDLISQGGGCFARTDKFIAISPEMKALFAISEDKLTPNELIKRLLQAPVDLIWNGGIGTYIKHSSETHGEVGDRANDAVRVNGNEVRAKVIGEGGNLGMTQRGRIEAALNGVRLNTDAIDNSGGVNCSDHEVNIKILLNQEMERGSLTLEERNVLLASMTDEVAHLVLQQNILQPQVLAMAAQERLHEHVRIMRLLEREGLLDRAIEYLPSEEALQSRQALTAPELAVLLAYSKMWVYERMLNSKLPDNAYYQADLARYFPQALGRYETAMHQHRLRREIISTYMTNDVVNRMGFSFMFQAVENSGRSVEDVAKAYTLARETFNAHEFWQAIEALDNRVPAELQIKMLLQVKRLLERATFWFLQLPNIDDVADIIQCFAPQVQALLNGGWFQSYFGDLPASASWQAEGVPANLADALALFPYAINALDVVWLASQHQQEREQVAKRFFDLQTRLHGDWFALNIAALPSQDYWEKRAQWAQINAFNHVLRHLVPHIEDVAAWAQKQEESLSRLDKVIAEWGEQAPSLASVTVLIGELQTLNA